MKRFDICPVGKQAVGTRRGRFVVILQHDSLDMLTTVVVAPLFKPDEYKVVEKLTPVLNVDGQRYVAAIDRIASVPKADLGKAIANVEIARLELLNATDFLLTGY